MPKLSSENRKQKIIAHVSPEIKHAIFQECMRRSKPGHRVTESDIVFELLKARYNIKTSAIGLIESDIEFRNESVVNDLPPKYTRPVMRARKKQPKGIG